MFVKQNMKLGQEFISINMKKKICLVNLEYLVVEKYIIRIIIPIVGML